MAWKVELGPLSQRQLKALDPQVRRRILDFLHKRIAALDDPRGIGEALRGADLGEYWKYRVGDYRIICSIQDKQVKILVIRIRNRREVCR